MLGTWMKTLLHYVNEREPDDLRTSAFIISKKV